MNQLQDEPFALIGVNLMKHPPAKLKAAMQKEKINWRSFTDQTGAISQQWNYPATPAFYVLDAKGTIRKKWIGHPGEKTIDKVLDRLLKELKTRRRPDSR